MNQITLAKVGAASDFMRQRAQVSHAVVRVQSGTIALDEDGEHLFTFLKMPDKYPLAPFMGALQRLSYVEHYRTGGLLSRSCTFGFAPRIAARRDFCGVADAAFTHPQEHATMIEYGRYSSEIYKEMLPDQHAAQLKLLDDKVADRWREPGCHFTSGIANDKNPLAYHTDAGNFLGTMSTMLTVTRDMGNVSGMLVLPEYGVGFEFNGFELLMFNGAEIVHGVTPMRTFTAGSMRYSVVYYALQGMANCGTPEEELVRIREVKSGREKKKVSPA